MSECECYDLGGDYQIYGNSLDESFYDLTNVTYSGGFCRFNDLNKTACTSLGFNYATCEDLDSYECSQCSLQNSINCTIPSYINLRCKWRTYECTQSECTPYCSGMENFPACVVPNEGILDRRGCLDCPPGLTSSFLGCLNFTYGNHLNQSKTQCADIKGLWIEKATNKTACESYVGCQTIYSSTCKSINSNTFANGLIEFDTGCISPRGTPKSAFTWVIPKMVNLEVINGTWFPNIWTPENQWINLINTTAITQKFEEALLVEPARSIQNMGICKYSSTAPYLTTILGNCASSSNRTVLVRKYQKEEKKEVFKYDNFVCNERATVDNFNSVPLGSYRFYQQVPATFSLGSAKLITTSSSIPSDLFCLDASLRMYGSTQFTTNLTAIKADPYYSLLPVKNNVYAVINNANGVKVGQFIGDGVRVTLSLVSAGTPTYPDDTAVYNITTSRFRSVSISLCIQPRQDISVTTKFSLIAFASTTDFSTFAVDDSIKVTQSGDFYCGIISSSGIYFPVAVLSNYQSLVYNPPVITKKDIAYYSVLAGLFWIVGIACLLDALFQVIKLGADFQPYILMFAGLHGIDRAIYFTLLASKVITDSNFNTKSREAGIMFLIALHVIFFFTVFSSMIYYWTSVSHKHRPQSSFLTLGKILLLILNLVLYIFFFIVVILHGTLNHDYDRKKSLRGLLITIASFSVALFIYVISHSIYFFNGKKEDAYGKRAKEYIRLTMVTYATTVAMLGLVGYTIYLSWRKPSSDAVFGATIITEVVPLYIILINLFIYFDSKSPQVYPFQPPDPRETKHLKKDTKTKSPSFKTSPPINNKKSSPEEKPKTGGRFGKKENNNEDLVL
eukprot:TRINITY_DN4556_c0_g1_i2.p1 TRINITY_DN4556_c0_g1~~TRINITY_DN4556_c0_g1_i2.p1  ORF type:complete len:846 (-),score=195.29 TRINITY_DN4556_c0_g1_i2:28-2565(-)